VATHVFGHHQEYVPLFVYSVLRSYPEYYCKVFIAGEARQHVLQALELVRTGLSTRFEIIQLGTTDVETITSSTRRGRNDVIRRSMRWFLPAEAFEGFEFLYIGDIDFLIVPEQPSLADQHVRHMNATGMPYSNAVRPGKRMTGLHFARTQDYFDGLRRAGMEDFASVQAKLEERDPLGADEHVLFTMTRVAFAGSGAVPERFRPYHGFHLAAARHSLAGLLWHDSRHTDVADCEGHFGWNCYAREELLECMRTLFLGDPLFWTLYRLNASESMHRMLVLLNRTSPHVLGPLRSVGLAASRRGVRRLRSSAVKFMRRLSGRRGVSREACATAPGRAVAQQTLEDREAVR
jgi:hypothetical protein